MGERFWAWSTIYGAEGEHQTPYMTRIWIGRLRLHIFYRGDADPDPHDHPWDFWTFPFTSYVEEVTVDTGWREHWRDGAHLTYPAEAFTPFIEGSRPIYKTHLNVVRAFRLHFRPATHTHRVLWRHRGFGKIVTLVWRGPDKRRWGFLKSRDGQWCWVHWKQYVYGGGKHAPCE